MKEMNTAYDDVFRTLIVDCKTLIIPVVNEVFHTDYCGNEKIVSHENEIFKKQQESNEEKIITDSSFEIVSDDGETRGFHFECQSTKDGSMIIRMYEYDSQIALKNSEILNHTLRVKFPESAILYLRHDATTPDVFEIIIQTPNGSISYNVPVLKVKHYDIETIFEKRLLFFIPFYIFTYENSFVEINDNEARLQALKNEYAFIITKLEELVSQGVINQYTKKTICEMSERVIKKLARKFQRIRKEVTSVMGGKVLEYEAKTIMRKGMQEGVTLTLCELVRDGLLDIEEAAKRANMTIEEFQKKMK